MYRIYQMSWSNAASCVGVSVPTTASFMPLHPNPAIRVGCLFRTKHIQTGHRSTRWYLQWDVFISRHEPYGLVAPPAKQYCDKPPDIRHRPMDLTNKCINSSKFISLLTAIFQTYIGNHTHFPPDISFFPNFPTQIMAKIRFVRRIKLFPSSLSCYCNWSQA